MGVAFVLILLGAGMIVGAFLLGDNAVQTVALSLPGANLIYVGHGRMRGWH